VGGPSPVGDTGAVGDTAALVESSKGDVTSSTAGSETMLALAPTPSSQLAVEANDALTA